MTELTYSDLIRMLKERNHDLGICIGDYRPVMEGWHEMRYGYYHLECIPSSLFKENVNPFGADKELHDLVLRKLINDEKRKRY